MIQRLPDYYNGRFFLSPILGCYAGCRFCYIYDKGYKYRPSINNFSIYDSIQHIQYHKKFKQGKEGSIISIGAWGDPFPQNYEDLTDFSLSWLKAVSKLENPIQIMSRFSLSDKVIQSIVNNSLYKGHILYSTSITSVQNSHILEPNADKPQARLKTISKMKNFGVLTNIMVKPFIAGVTDYDVFNFIATFREYHINYCVVGNLLVNENINKRMQKYYAKDHSLNSFRELEKLDCSPDDTFWVEDTARRSLFIKTLEENGIKVFRKSSCVNSYLLNQVNPANYYKEDPHSYCIRCGACEQNSMKK
jgi:DNA repair photolyase